MSYQVLARKWRPQDFTQVAGQGHVLRALINALDQGRLHHAYLFTGTRGVGKTTLARILAKCLNCEQGVSSHPCGECGACQEIDSGRFVDLIEVDAASRTKVEDTRELLDNVQYAPTRGRYKVYLIDEVHMLSGHSFNALLKTLEEPPPHVKFLLATTDPQKLPVTVLSRCLQFNLKRLSRREIVDQMGQILREEGIEAEAAALSLLAQAAEGSMRDALSLLDQAIAFGNGRVGEAEVSEMLGTVSRVHVRALVEALCARDASGLMAATDHLAEQAVDFEDVLGQLISVFHQAALWQFLPRDEEGMASTERELAGQVAGALSAEDIQLYYQIALLGRRDLPLAPEPRMGFEMTLLRLLSFEVLTAPQDRRPDAQGAGAAAPDRGARSGPQAAAPAAVQRPAGAPAGPERATAASAPRKAGTGGPDGGTTGGPGKAATAPAAQLVPPAPDSGDGALDWLGLLPRLRLRGIPYALASNCSLGHRSADEVCLVLAVEHTQLRTSNAERRVEQALRDYFDDPELRLRIEVGEHRGETLNQVRDRQSEERQQGAEQAIAEDPVVQEMVETFGASVVPGSVRPVDSGPQDE